MYKLNLICLLIASFAACAVVCPAEEQVTLADFIDHLDPWVPTLQLLASLHEKAVVSCTQPKCVYRVCHLLRTVQESIMEQYSMGESTQQMVTGSLRCHAY